MATVAGCRAMLLRPGAAGVLTSAAAAPRTGGGGSPRPPGVGLPGAVRGRWPGDLDQSRRRREDDCPRQVCSSRHTSKPSRQSCATRGRADKPQRGEQAGIPGRGQPQQGEATPPSAAGNHVTTESATDCAAAPRSCRHISARPRARRPALPEPDSCVAAPNFGFATKRAAGPTRPRTAARWTGPAGTHNDA